MDIQRELKIVYKYYNYWKVGDSRRINKIIQTDNKRIEKQSF